MNENKHLLSIIGTELNKLQDIAIKNGQLIFLKDKGRIVFDLNDRRTFYDNEWVQLTGKEQCQIVKKYVLPSEGTDDSLYINMSEKNIFVWDEENRQYVLVGEAINSVSNEDINKMFK